MSDYVVIEEDRVKLALYTAGNLILTLVLMFICAEFMNRIFYLGVFLGATGIWFSVKYMFRYGKKLFAGTPVCEFKKKELVIHSLPGNAVTMQYSKIKEVKVLRDWKSVKIFIASSEVKHPSGWNYVGAVSYTHLDVYKRQGLDYVQSISLLPCRHGFQYAAQDQS